VSGLTLGSSAKALETVALEKPHFLASSAMVMEPLMRLDPFIWDLLSRVLLVNILFSGRKFLFWKEIGPLCGNVGARRLIACHTHCPWGARLPTLNCWAQMGNIT